jgi:hypothetical protein
MAVAIQIAQLRDEAPGCAAGHGSNLQSQSAIEIINWTLKRPGRTKGLR